MREMFWLSFILQNIKQPQKIKQMKPYAGDGQAKDVHSQQHEVKVNIHLYIYMHVTTMKIRSHKFERKGGIYGRA